MNLDVLAALVKNLGRPYPARDWTIIVTVTGLIFLCGAALATYLFIQVQTGSLVGVSATPPKAPIPVSRDSLKNVLETYQQRAANFANKSFPAVEVVDPRPKTTKK